MLGFEPNGTVRSIAGECKAMNEAAADAMNPHNGRTYAAAGAASGVGASAGVDRPTRAVFAAVTGRPQAHAATSRDAALDTLRAFVTVLVVAHHSVIAYALISPAAAPRSPVHPWLAGIPIVDSHRLAVFDLFALFNDTFFMSLMFLLSGLFVGPSLARKGSASFLRDRALRLGAPFVVMALMTPLAYYPAYRAWAAAPERARILARMAVARDLAERPAVVRRGAARVRCHRGRAVPARS